MTTSWDHIDIRLLRYFAIIAEEGGLRRASERLFISQPPLTRQLRKLEETLGMRLFTRHSKGLALTDEGRQVLDTIRPLLACYEQTMTALQGMAVSEKTLLHIGFTTAFEQGIFACVEQWLHDRFGERLRLVRSSSPKLAENIWKGKLDAALVALPLDAPGLDCESTGYSEPLAAALPESWALEYGDFLPLARCSGRPLFWFRRESNPAFFDFTKKVFSYAGFEPLYLEEPAEHDVLLARIAAGEGMGLIPESFAAIRRQGVVFASVTERELLRVELGCIAAQGKLDQIYASCPELRYSGNFGYEPPGNP